MAKILIENGRIWDGEGFLDGNVRIEGSRITAIGGENGAASEDFAGLLDAKARGVVIDAGMAGHIHTDFAVLAEAIRRGILPDVISTDITHWSAYMRGGRYGLTLCMSMARALGMSEADIFHAVTSAPARALGQPGWGRLGVGSDAELAVLQYTDEGFDLIDRAGNRLCAEKGWRCRLTVSGGKVVYRD